MNDLEFREQYKRLKEVHPNMFGSGEKLKTVWAYVQDTEEFWFRSLVDRIVMSSKGDKIDIGEAVASERRNRRSVKFAEDVAAAADAWGRATHLGLENILEQYKAGSLFEAIEKSRKGEV